VASLWQAIVSRLLFLQGAFIRIAFAGVETYVTLSLSADTPTPFGDIYCKLNNNILYPRSIV
jgi:hypothetical protein